MGEVEIAGIRFVFAPAGSDGHSGADHELGKPRRSDPRYWAGYDEDMVDQVLLEQVLQLDEAARRSLIAVLQSSLDDGAVSPEIAALIDQRVADADENPDEFVSLADFECEVRARRSA